MVEVDKNAISYLSLFFSGNTLNRKMNKTILIWCFTTIAIAFVECSIVRFDSEYDIHGKVDLTADEVREKELIKNGKTKPKSGKSFDFFLKIKFVCLLTEKIKFTS